MSNADGISATMQDKIPIVETHAYVTNELCIILVGDNNMCPKYTKNNPTLFVRRTLPNEHASFDFVEMLENMSNTFSEYLDVKSYVQYIDAAFNASNKYLLAFDGAVTDDLIDDDDRGGDINIARCAGIKLE